VGAGNAELRDELRSAFDRVLQSGNYILSQEVDNFEDEFASYCGVRYAIGVGNGLDALTIALRAAGIGAGDEVIVPAHTFIATWLSVVACGATLVPVDVDPDRLLIDLAAAEAACSQRTAAIIPVHIYGQPVPPEPMERFGKRYGVAIIGDAAQAHGAAVGGKSVGALGLAAAFSFYPAKNLGALGDAGIITSSDLAFATRAKRLRNYGARSKYDFLDQGVNSRLDPMQAAFLSVKLGALERWNARRTAIAERYLEELRGLPDLTLPCEPEATEQHAWYSFCIRHPRRDDLKHFLETLGIETQVYYPVPPHLSPAFKSLERGEGAYPVSESVARTALSLPIGPHLDDDSVTRIIEAVRQFR
jgi:dTDP-3-amino-3,4,6-trideoxy-alpha-D-glucose transaminase